MRAFLCFIMSMLVATAALAVDGINTPGHDYADFPAPSAFVCRTTCGGDPACHAYTWVKPGYQGPQGHCWLKWDVPALVKDPCCDSGPRMYISKADMKPEAGIDRPGSDLGSFTALHSPADCQAACAANGSCSAWTYVRPGVQGPTNRCWLKNRLARPVANAATVSGVKYRPAAGPID